MVILLLVPWEGYLLMAWHQAAAADDPDQLIAAPSPSPWAWPRYSQEPDPRRAHQTPRMKAG
jgi:hypothetical protein